MVRETRPHFYVVAAVIGLAFACTAIGESAYWWYAGEEGFAEAAQVFFFVIAAGYAFRAPPDGDS